LRRTANIFVNYANKTRNLAWKAAYTLVTEFQGHYPERLQAGIVNHAPWYLNAFFSLVQPLLDPVTREKLRFNVKVVETGLIEPDMINEEWWGGNRNFDYVHEKYYEPLVSMCEQRRSVWKE
jgi:hypothetical protein